MCFFTILRSMHVKLGVSEVVYVFQVRTSSAVASPGRFTGVSSAPPASSATPSTSTCCSSRRSSSGRKQRRSWQSRRSSDELQTNTNFINMEDQPLIVNLGLLVIPKPITSYRC